MGQGKMHNILSFLGFFILSNMNYTKQGPLIYSNKIRGTETAS